MSSHADPPRSSATPDTSHAERRVELPRSLAHLAKQTLADLAGIAPAALTPDLTLAALGLTTKPALRAVEEAIDLMVDRNAPIRTVGDMISLVVQEARSLAAKDAENDEEDEEEDEDEDEEPSPADRSLSALDLLARSARGSRLDEVFALRSRAVEAGEMPRWARPTPAPYALLRKEPAWITVCGACAGPREPGALPALAALPVDDPTLVDGESYRAEGILDERRPVLIAADIEALRTSPPRPLHHGIVRAARGCVPIWLRGTARPTELASRFDVVTTRGDEEDIVLSQVLVVPVDKGTQESTRAAFRRDGEPPPSLFTLRDAAAAPPVRMRFESAKVKARDAAWFLVKYYADTDVGDRRIVSTAALREHDVEIHVEDEMRVALFVGGALRWLRSGTHELPEGAALLLAWNEIVRGPVDEVGLAAAGGLEALARWADRRSERGDWGFAWIEPRTARRLLLKGPDDIVSRFVYTRVVGVNEVEMARDELVSGIHRLSSTPELMLCVTRHSLAGMEFLSLRAGANGKVSLTARRVTSTELTPEHPLNPDEATAVIEHFESSQGKLPETVTWFQGTRRVVPL